MARQTDTEPPALVRSSIYLPGRVHDALREIAYRERRKVHDLIMEGIDTTLRRRGYPSVDSLRGTQADE